MKRSHLLLSLASLLLIFFTFFLSSCNLTPQESESKSESESASESESESQCPHRYDNDCDTACNECGATRTAGDHAYDNACDALCNICNAERTPDHHKYENGCDTDCNICGKRRNPAPHRFDNACDTDCNVCHATRKVGEHRYDNACDADCNECGVIRSVPNHVYDNGCDTSCSVCGHIRTVSGHEKSTVWSADSEKHWYECTVCHKKFDEADHTPGNAATEDAAQYCTVCDYMLAPPLSHEHDTDTEWTSDGEKHWKACKNGCTQRWEESNHIYDNACDTDCNVCHAIRSVPDHVYDNGCDTVCNVCDHTRTVNGHVYDNACDPDCNECNSTRTVGDHAYHNACDPDCNECGATRQVPDHVYDGDLDTSCNVCGAIREIATLTTTYTVNVQLQDGLPVRATVKIYNGANEVASANANTGTATFELPMSTYTVAITPVSTYASYYYDESKLSLSSASPTLTVTLIPKLTAVPNDEISPWDTENGYPYSIAASGVSYVTVTDSDRSIFLFQTNEPGLYRISLKTLDGKTVPVKYYGTPMSCFEMDAKVTGPDNAFFIVEVQAAHTTSANFPGFVCMVFNNTGESYDALLSVERVGDEIFDPSYDEYINVVPEKPLSPTCFSYANWSYTVNNLDITDESLTVVLGSDGYYHLGTADGPLVYAYVSKPSPYITFSFQDITAAGDRFGAYFAGDEIYEQGKNDYTHKELYNLLIDAYAAVCDPVTGLVPMTEELAHAIRSHGEHAGWWSDNPSFNLFIDRETGEKTVDYKENVAWLFACATVEITKGASGSSAEAPVVSELGGTVVFDAADTLYFSLTANTSAITFTSTQNDFSVSYNGSVLAPENSTDAVTGETVYKVTVNAEADVPALSVTYTGSAENVTLDFIVATK